MPKNPGDPRDKGARYLVRAGGDIDAVLGRGLEGPEGDEAENEEAGQRDREEGDALAAHPKGFPAARTTPRSGSPSDLGRRRAANRGRAAAE